MCCHMALMLAWWVWGWLGLCGVPVRVEDAAHKTNIGCPNKQRGHARIITKQSVRVWFSRCEQHSCIVCRRSNNQFDFKRHFYSRYSRSSRCIWPLVLQAPAISTTTKTSVFPTSVNRLNNVCVCSQVSMYLPRKGHARAGVLRVMIKDGTDTTSSSIAGGSNSSTSSSISGGSSGGSSGGVGGSTSSSTSSTHSDSASAAWFDSDGQVDDNSSPPLPGSYPKLRDGGWHMLTLTCDVAAPPDNGAGDTSVRGPSGSSSGIGSSDGSGRSGEDSSSGDSAIKVYRLYVDGALKGQMVRPVPSEPEQVCENSIYSVCCGL